MHEKEDLKILIERYGDSVKRNLWKFPFTEKDLKYFLARYWHLKNDSMKVVIKRLIDYNYIKPEGKIGWHVSYIVVS